MSEEAFRRATPVKKVPSAVTRGSGSSSKLRVDRALAEDSADTRSQLILTAIQGFRDGDFSVRLPIGWLGTGGR